MSETIHSTQQEGAPGADPSPVVARSTRWTRTHTIWLLISLSLAPGVAAAAFRDGWQQLPAGVRLSAYILSGILIAAAFALILAQGGSRDGNDS
jgi:hypothetical protein